MEKQPLVSIVTPSLNQGHLLPQAIESVLRQDYPNLEYLIVDGGSTDGSLEVIRSYDGRLRWISEPDTGQSNALNKGFRLCSGEILAWINADDVLLEGAVRKAVEAFAEDPDLGMVYGEGYVIDETGNVKSRFPYTEDFDLYRLIHVGDSILQQTAFMRRAALEQAGFLDESLRWGLDWDLFIRLGQRFRIRRLEEYLGCIREYGATKTSTGGFPRLRELGRIIRNHAGGRFVPAYFSYGLDTCYAALSRRCRPAGKPVLDRIQTIVGNRVWGDAARCQGWYEGGWAGRRVHFILPSVARGARLRIGGELPQLSPDPPKQTLSIYGDGRRLTAAELPLGPFELVAALPDAVNGGGALRVELLATRKIGKRRFYPANRPTSVCYRLHEVEVV